MKGIIKTICENYKLECFLDNSLFVKKWLNEKVKEYSDFFYFLELGKDDFLTKDNDYYKDLIKDLWKNEISWEKLEDLKQFDKNLNLIILLKINTPEDFTDELRKQIYQVEENPYYSNKFVIVYTDKQIEKLDILEELKMENLSKSFDNLLENRQKQKDKQFTKEDFIFDLITSLHFITFKFKITDWSENLNIFDESSRNLDKALYIHQIYQELIKIDWDSKDILNEKILKNNDIWEDLSEFEKEIIELSKELFLDKDFYNIEQTFEEFKTNFKKDEQI